MELTDYRNLENRFFVRTTSDISEAENAFGRIEVVRAEGVTGELGFVTEKMTEAEYEQKAAKLGGILQMIRVN